MAIKKSIKTAEIGGTGTTVYNGVVSDVEYNSSLSTEYGSMGLSIYNRMRKSDPIVKASLSIIKLAILQAEWYVEMEEENEELKEFVEEALFERMTKPFKEVLKDILTYLEFGFYVGEKVFKVEDNKIYWEKFAYRDPKSIVKFETKDKKQGVTQHLDGQNVKDREPSIPIEKLLIFTNDKEGDNWRGVSILRSAYKPWFFKENYEKIDAIGFEREAVGVPVFKMPSNPDPVDVDKAEELGKNLRANEKQHLILPYGWEFEVQYPSGGQRRNSDEAIRRFNRDILANVLAQFLDLGSGATGSRALSTDQSDAFYRSLQAIGDYICSVFNEYAIKQLVDLNFDSVDEYPKLNVTGIQKVDLDAFSVAIQRLAMANVIQPDDDLEDYVRDQLGLPEKGEPREQPMGMGVDNFGKPLNPEEKKSEKDNEKKKEEKKEAVKGNEQKKKIFQDTGIVDTAEPEFWRPRTFAEQKVNFFSLRRQMDRLEKEMNLELPKELAPEINSLLTDARMALQTGDIKRVEDLTIKFKDRLRDYLIGKITYSFETGKLTASNELDIPAPKTTNEIVNLIVTQANSMASKITDDLLNNAKLTILSQIQQQRETGEALSSLDEMLNDQLLRSIRATSSAVVVGGINTGRKSVFDENPDKIYALQRSELLDNRVCNYCLSMDGRVVEKDDRLANIGQFHFLCRGLWVEILTDETEKPAVTGVPEQLRDRAGTLGEFEQLNKPIPLNNSLADRYVKRE